MRSTTIVALILVVAAGLAALLWFYPWGPDEPSSKRRAGGRLLVGFDPAAATRIKVEIGSKTIERERLVGRWVPRGGQTRTEGDIRVGVLLGRLARLAVNTVKMARPPDAAAKVTVWRGRARPLRLTFYRLSGRLLVETSDRPGLYEVKAALWRLLSGEAQAVRITRALAFDPDRLRTVTLTRAPAAKSKPQLVILRRHKTTRTWSALPAGGAAIAADPTRVSQLLRQLHALRVTVRIGDGEAAVARHGLDQPLLTVETNDGIKRRVRLGAKCPKKGGGRLATLPEPPIRVVCLADPEATELTKVALDFASTRIWRTTADGLSALVIAVGRRPLELVNRVGRGGWKIVGRGEKHSIDQDAAASYVAALMGLRAVGSAGAELPEGAHPYGKITARRIDGGTETVELARRRGRRGQPDARWARAAKTRVWRRLGRGAKDLVEPEPVVFRSREICRASDPESAVTMLRVSPEGTDLVHRDRGTWQHLIIDGRPKLERTGDILAKLSGGGDKKKRRAKRQQHAWPKPIRHVGAPDPQRLSRLLSAFGVLRAERFVASRPSRQHGFSKQGVRLGLVYLANCQGEGAKRQCQRRRCEVVLGGRHAGGGCYAQLAGDRAVFIAPRNLCQVSGNLLASRRVVILAVHQADRMVIADAKRKVTLERGAGGSWQRTGGPQPSPTALSDFLIRPAPLTARDVSSYGDPLRRRAPTVSIWLQKRRVPEIALRFFAPKTAKGTWRVVRQGRPVVYTVAAATGEAIQRFVAGLK